MKQQFLEQLLDHVLLADIKAEINYLCELLEKIKSVSLVKYMDAHKCCLGIGILF